MDDGTSSRSANPGDLIFIDPAGRLEIRGVSPSERDAVANLVHTNVRPEIAGAMLDALGTLPDSQVFVGLREHAIAAAYAIRKDGLANDLPVIVVAANQRRKGIGRALLQDALRRSGRRPLAAQTPEEILPFFKACGFKLVGRRVQPSGETWFRVGWHAPGARFKGGTSTALDHRGVTRDTENDA